MWSVELPRRLTCSLFLHFVLNTRVFLTRCLRALVTSPNHPPGSRSLGCDGVVHLEPSYRPAHSRVIQAPHGRTAPDSALTRALPAWDVVTVSGSSVCHRKVSGFERFDPLTVSRSDSLKCIMCRLLGEHTPPQPRVTLPSGTGGCHRHCPGRGFRGAGPTLRLRGCGTLSRVPRLSVYVPWSVRPAASLVAAVTLPVRGGGRTGGPLRPRSL